MRGSDFCICENRGADQLCSNIIADRCLYFCYADSTIPPLPIFRVSGFWHSFVSVQAGLRRTWLDTRRPVFSRRGSNIVNL